MPAGEHSSVEELLREVRRLRVMVADNEEALRIISKVERFLADSEGMAISSIKRLSREKSRDELVQFIDGMRRDEDVEGFIEAAKYSWTASRTFALAVQLLWIVTAAISFMMGIYLFFPPYIFFGSAHGNASATIQRTLELILQNPQVLSVINPLFKILGFVMMAIALVSLYQAHLIGTSLRESQGG